MINHCCPNCLQRKLVTSITAQKNKSFHLFILKTKQTQTAVYENVQMTDFTSQPFPPSFLKMDILLFA